VIVLVVVVCVSLASLAHATADGPDFYRAQGIAPGASVPLQAEPRTDAPRVGTINAKAVCLRNLGCQGGLTLEEFSTLSEADRQLRLASHPRWCRVEHRGTSGWIQGHYLAEAPCGAASARAGIVTHRIDLRPGTSSAVRKGRITGSTTIDYQITGRAGQTLTVNFQGSNPQNYTNVNAPGSDVSMFVGSMSGERFQRVLPADGTYTVRVYLMRAAARRNERSRYTLVVRLSGVPLLAVPSVQDARIAGTPFHASAVIACSHPADAPQRACEALVLRRGFDATATVEIRWAVGSLERTRRILFVEGRVVSTDGPDAVQQQRVGDRSVIRVGAEERYEIPDVLLTGG